MAGPELVDQVGAVHVGIPEGQRAAAVVFTGSCGEAGAIGVLGGDAGLPPASSAHNNYWLWGPPREEAPSSERDMLGRCSLSSVHRAPDVVCLEPSGTLADIGGLIRHYN